MAVIPGIVRQDMTVYMAIGFYKDFSIVTEIENGEPIQMKKESPNPSKQYNEYLNGILDPRD